MGFGPHGHDFTIARAIFRQGQGGLSSSPDLPACAVRAIREGRKNGSEWTARRVHSLALLASFRRANPRPRKCLSRMV